MYYSTIGLLAVLVLFIVNQDILLHPQVSYNKPVWKVYRRFLFAVLIYYIVDILWGILEDQKLTAALFVDTTIYFVAMAVGIAFWAEYTVSYLEEKNAYGRFLIHVGRAIAIIITILVVVNIFTPVLFTIDKACVYHDLATRDVMLACQILMLLTISVYAFVSMLRTDKSSGKRQRFRILASFGMIMGLFLFIQLFFPYLPVYSIAYMLGTCMLHSFVAIDEKEDFKREQEASKKEAVLKNRFISILDNIPGLAFTKDAETGVYLACNSAFVKYAHKENADQVIGLTDAELFDEETAAHFVEADKMALSLSKPYIFFEDVPDGAGNPRQLQTTKLRYTDTDGRICILGMCEDVTDMVRIQHEQAMTQKAYEEAVSSGVIYTNIAQTLARDYIDLYYINKDTEEYVEYRKGKKNTLTEVRRGWHFFSDCKAELAEKVCDEDRDSFLQAMKRKTLMKALDAKDTFSMTYRQKSESGPVYVNMKISLMSDEQYIIMGITDVDAEMRETMAKNRAMAEALNSAEAANRAKSTFLSGMSHELRTPMNAIIGFNTLALKNENIDDETRGYLEKIGDSADHLRSIINDILDMSRIESGRVVVRKEEFSLDSLLEKINTMVMSQCSEKGLTYECHILNQLDNTYIGDESKIREVLVNILSNAVKFTNAPGSVILTIDKTSEYDNKSTIRFHIKDTGIGMDKDFIPSIFESFAREDNTSGKKYDSSGLGMPITKRLVDMMKGTISVESEKGVGTEFTVILSLDNCEKTNENLLRKIDKSAFYILVVDDNPVEAEHAKTILEEAGLRADACTSGQDALRKMEMQHSKREPYNLVLMDWVMPGMNGRETSEEIMKLYENETTVVALTANNWDDIQEEAHKVGVQDALVKPLFAANVLDDIEQIARRSRMDVFKEKNKANLTGRRILLAEDVQINAEIMIDALELENIKVDHADNGKAAVEMFEKSTAGIYAAILMDVRMPQMDGLEAAKIIRAMDREDAKKIPIIALTANAFDEDVQHSIQAGMNAHLNKPVETEQLLRVLGELVYEAEQ